MKSYAIVDSCEMPIVTVTFTGEKSTDLNFEQYLDELQNCYAERKRIAIIFDASEAVIPNISHQKKQALWISQNWKMIQTYCTGTAYVIPNLAIRTVLKMIFSFQNQPVPYKIFSNLEDAQGWINKQLTEENRTSIL